MKNGWCLFSLILLLGSVAFGCLYYRGIGLGYEAATRPFQVSMALFDSAHAALWIALVLFVGCLLSFYICQRKPRKKI